MTASGRSFSMAAKSRFKLFEAAECFIINHDPDGRSAGLDLFEKRLRKWIGRLSQRHNPMRRRQHLPDQFYAFATELRVHSRHAGNVAARPTEALDKPVRYRVSGERHHNRNITCRCLCRLRGWSEPSHDEVHIEPDQLGG